MQTIELYATESEPLSKEQIDKIVSLAIEAGYRPLNGIPKSARGKKPYLSFHFIACGDVPDHQ